MKTKKSLTVKCFQCQKEFSIKWVLSQQNYSQKNNLDYWTEVKKDKNKKVCNKCLRDFYNEKWGNYYGLSPKKKNLFRVYLATGKFD